MQWQDLANLSYSLLSSTQICWPNDALLHFRFMALFELVLKPFDNRDNGSNTFRKCVAQENLVESE